MTSIKGALMAMALSVVANGIAIPSVEDMGLAKREESGVFLLDFSVTQGPPLGSRIRKRGTPEGEFYNQNYLNGLYYVIDLVIGSQKDPVQVTLDTGSSDLWVVPIDVDCQRFEWAPSADCSSAGTYDPTKSSTFKNLTEDFTITYADFTAAWGYFATDSVGLTNGPTLSNFQFAVAAHDQAGLGILGVGRENLEAMHTGFGYPTYPNFPQVMKDQGFINKNAYSIYFNEPNGKSGTIVFGGYDSEKFSGSLVKLPIVNSPTFGYQTLSVNLGSATIANGTLIDMPPSSQTVILDTGADGLMIDDDLYNTVKAELYGGANGAYACEQGSRELTFNFDGVSIAVPYTDLVQEATDEKGNGLGYCILSIFNTSGLGVILGLNFLRNAYALFDLEENYISLAQVKYSNSTNLVSL